MPRNIILVVALLAVTTLGYSAESVWDGGSASSNNWSAAQNWVSNTAPLAGNNVRFEGFSRLYSVVDAPSSVSKLTFGNTAGSFTLSGSTLTLGNGGIEVQSSNPQTILNNLNLQGNQTWVTKGDLVLDGEINGNGANVTKTETGTLTLSGTTANTGISNFTAFSGTTVLDKNNGVEALSGNLAIEKNATVRLDSSEQISNNGQVTIASKGKLNVNSKMETVGSLGGSGEVTLGTGRLTIGGNYNTIYGGKISGKGGLTQAGNGITTLSGVNTYTGQTIISGGTLRLGNNNRIADSSGLVLAGGTFDTNGFNEKMGLLTLTADSSINFTGNSSVLSFDKSSGVTWNTGSILTVNSWNGHQSGGGPDQLRVGVSGLNAGQLAQIKFFNPAGLAAGTYDATLLANGEVVPVPEPATLALGGLLLGLVGMKRRKKNA